MTCLPPERDPGSADHLMIVVLPEGTDRRALTAALEAAGVRTGVHFPPLHHLSWFEDHAEIAPGGTPVADALAPRVLSLPLHPMLTADEVDTVCGASGGGAGLATLGSRWSSRAALQGTPAHLPDETEGNHGGVGSGRPTLGGTQVREPTARGLRVGGKQVTASVTDCLQ